MNSHHAPRLLTALFTMAAISAATSFAAAQDCSQDVDCWIANGFDYRCLPQPTTCVVEPGGEDADCDSTDVGQCVHVLICTVDEDCPSHLECQNQVRRRLCDDAEESCTTNPDFVGQPVEDSGYCAFREIACDADSDCPADFECQTFTEEGDCAELAPCPADSNCEPEYIDCGGISADYGLCVPREIACDANADCPTDWACVTETFGSCSGSSGGSDGDAPAPGEDTDGAQAAPDLIAPECDEETLSRCLPPGFDQGGGGTDHTGDNSGDDGGSDEGIFEGDDEGGSRSSCSTIDLSPSSGGLPLLLLLGLVTIGARRMARR